MNQNKAIQGTRSNAGKPIVDPRSRPKGGTALGSGTTLGGGITLGGNGADNEGILDPATLGTQRNPLLARLEREREQKRNEEAEAKRLREIEEAKNPKP